MTAPRDYQIARDQWARYCYMRDTGHSAFVKKATTCDDFFSGMQWDPAVVKELELAKRPALTINKILITLSSVLGEQIDLRSETVFRPRFGAPPQNADVLTKLFRCISDDNQLNWVRSDVFADGMITSRGFFDVRLSFKKNIAGEIAVKRLNPKSVMIDPGASEYDPEEWNDVVVTSWATPDDIRLMYSKPNVAEKLANRSDSVWNFGFDSMDVVKDTFGQDYGNYINSEATDELSDRVDRSIRVIDRQHRILVKMKYFVDPKTGDKMRVPEDWDAEMVSMTANAGGLLVVEELGKRIRWTVTAEEFVLHDDWSPFERFTIVPFFPVLRHGRTIGVVESLIDPQNLLNKTLSQELHIVNTMANSGWKFRSGVLVGKEASDLEDEGAKTGLVLEVNGDPEKDVVKIQPNQIPQGLDRLSFKAENFIKTVSGRGDSQLGLDRADVSGKAIGEKKESSEVNLRMALDSLERTDHLLALHMLGLIQKFYTDHRIYTKTRSEYDDSVEEIAINMPDPNSGEILNDMTLGTYDIVISSQNVKRTLEETEFAQAVGLRELGIPIPDSFMLENSNLRGKHKVIKQMEEEANSPEGIAMREAAALKPQLEVAEMRGKITELDAKSAHARAKTADALASAQEKASGDGGEQAKMELEREKADLEYKLKEREHEQKLRFQQEEHAQELRLREQEAAEKRRMMRVQTIMAARQAAKQPGSGKPQSQGANSK